MRMMGDVRSFKTCGGARYLMASGLVGDPTAPMMGSGSDGELAQKISDKVVLCQIRDEPPRTQNYRWRPRAGARSKSQAAKAD